MPKNNHSSKSSIEKPRIENAIQLLCAIAGTALIAASIFCYITSSSTINGFLASLIGLVLIAIAKGYKRIELAIGKLKMLIS